MGLKKIFLGMFIGIFLFLFTCERLRAEEPGKPGKIVMNYVDKGLAILKDASLRGDDKLNERKVKLWDAILPVFDFEEMCKRVLRSNWKTISSEKKGKIVGLFTTVLKDAYIVKIDSFAGEKFVYLQEIQGTKHARVETKLILKTGREVAIDFSLLSKDDRWVINDVVIDGVSLVENYRRQFNSFLASSTVDELIKRLEKMALSV